MALTGAERERIASEQREANKRAIHQFATESPMRVIVPSALAVQIRFAEQHDGTSVQRALRSLADVRLIVMTLAEAEAMSQIAADATLVALDKVRDTLAGFAPVAAPPSCNSKDAKREVLAA